MADERKISYEQDQALARGRQVARANQRRRMAAKLDPQSDAERVNFFSKASTPTLEKMLKSRYVNSVDKAAIRQVLADRQ